MLKSHFLEELGEGTLLLYQAEKGTHRPGRFVAAALERREKACAVREAVTVLASLRRVAGCPCDPALLGRRELTCGLAGAFTPCSLGKD